MENTAVDNRGIKLNANYIAVNFITTVIKRQ